MIMNPSECRALLEEAVIIASVTPEEHRRLGHIYIHHRDLCGRMLKAHGSGEPKRRMERYSATGIALQRRRGDRAPDEGLSSWIGSSSLDAVQGEFGFKEVTQQ